MSGEGGGATGRWWGSGILDPLPDGQVWACGARDVTRGETRERIAELVALFGRHGVRPGDRVALQIPPSFTYLWALFALWEIGAGVMLLDHRLAAAERAALMALCRPRFDITSRPPAHPLKPFRDEREVLVTPLGGASGDRDAADTVLYQFSSGSTGSPKVVGRSARSILDEVDRFARLDGMPAREERVLLLNSLTHSFGLIGGVLHATRVGATLVFPQNIVARDLLALAADHRVQVISGVPAHFDLLGRIDGPALPSLRLAVCGGEALRRDVFDRFEQRYRVRIGQAYGMTEVGIIATDLHGVHPPPAVGRAAPGIEVDEHDGELYVRAEPSPYPYPEAGGAWADGWLRTFDVVSTDPGSGVISLRGRSDSMVVVGGLNVDLTEVEAVLRQHDGVQEVVVSFGDVVEAYVTSSDGDLSGADLAAWCGERLSRHKVPRVVHLLERLPRTSNGKLVRARDRLHAAVGAGRGGSA